MISIYELELTKTVYTEKKDWLDANDELEVCNYMVWDEFRVETLCFPTLKDMYDYIDLLTEGFIQYRAHVFADNSQSLEYHNGEEWDIEYYFKTKEIILPENVVNYIAESVNK